jgi:hypothetical protein
MPPPHEQRPRPDEDRVREAMKERPTERDDEAPDEAAEDDLDRDPAYNPDDPGLKDIKGG